jgi:hypothetical protein
MIGIRHLRLATARPRVAQPDRYVPVQFPTATNLSKQEVCS